MSQHVVVQGPTKVGDKWEDIKWVFGWDQALQSFYLQKHDALVEDPDENPVLWLGADADSRMYELEDLMKTARKEGLYIEYPIRVQLHGERDDGR